MSQLLEARRGLRRRINSYAKYDLFLHRFITVVLIANMLLILYALISVTSIMTLSGVGFLDSVPIALYILPLIVILPLMIRAYYSERTAAFNFLFLMICTVFFFMLSFLVHGFIIFLIFNIIAAVSIFILGRYRPRGKLREVGRGMVVYFILLNLLGLAFPISTIIMGQTQIASTSMGDNPEIILSIPLADFAFPYLETDPTIQLLSDIQTNDFRLDFRILENDDLSWLRLGTWLSALNDTGIQYSITLTADRALLAGENPASLATSELIEAIYASHGIAFDRLTNFELSNITNRPNLILFDMTLSEPEWQALMLRTRNLDLTGFAGLMRTSIFSIDSTRIEDASASLRDATTSSGIASGLLVETFVVDDLFDGDSYAMRLCGVTSSSLQEWDQVSVLCSRSRFSFEMSGDVGEYLCHSYSRSIGQFAATWSMRLGEIGNSTDISDRSDSVYEDLDVLVNDIALVTGNGVQRIILDSIPSLLNAFGSESLSNLRLSIDEAETGIATYTFRIYAYRAVFMAIDAFDLIML